MAMTDGDGPGRPAGGDPLEAAFAAARAAAAAPAPAALLARIEADAVRMAPAAGTSAGAAVGESAAARARPGPARWREVLQALGGWPGLGGLAAASAAGIWIGIAAPAALDGTGLVPVADPAPGEGVIAAGFFSALEEG